MAITDLGTQTSSDSNASADINTLNANDQDLQTQINGISVDRSIMMVLDGNAYVADDIITVRVPYAMTLTEVLLGVATAPTGASLNVDVRYHATDPTSAVTILSSDVTIAASAFSGTATPSTTSLAENGFLVVDINQIGSTLPGTGLIIEVKE
jgi:hypothetical protein